METPSPKFHKDAKINWYRCRVDPQLMRELMQTSDRHGLLQAGGHLGLFILTGTLAYLAFRQTSGANWYWSVPLLYGALFAHGTVGSFMGGAACHEMSHKTPFKTKALNNFFLKIYAFLSGWDHIWFRPSHIKHHQVTVYHDYDGEVVLPQKLTLRHWKFWLAIFAWEPTGTWTNYKAWCQRAGGKIEGDWYQHVLPEANTALRREHRRWAQFYLAGHLLLALAFILSGHWFLIVIVLLGTRYCGLLGFLCGTPQHYGLSPNVPDHRLSCRTYTCGWLPRFLYWNMQYHIEHHMFPSVPFYNLGRLHAAIAADLPPTAPTLRATWKELLAIHRRTQTDSAYVFVPPLPSAGGDHADDATLEREAALA